jgi:hypothetical protein
MHGSEKIGCHGSSTVGRAASDLQYRASERPITIRGGRGIGDALYLQSIVRHLTEKGRRLRVCTDWPDIFSQLGGSVETEPFRRNSVERVSHYTTRKTVEGTDQFQDCCINAGVSEPVDLRLDWRVVNPNVLSKAWNPHRLPIIVVQMPRGPFGRSDGYGLELLPDFRRIQDAIEVLSSKAFIIQVGAGKPLFKFEGVDLDLSSQTSVCDLLDIASLAHGFLGYCSFIVPLAESFLRPALLLWSRRGLQSKDEYIRTITPSKILHRASSSAAVDDCSDIEMVKAVDALLEQAGGSRALRG